MIPSDAWRLRSRLGTLQEQREEAKVDIGQLEVFLAVAEEKSFSRAGLRMQRTQAAISQTIKKLEDEIGETLFDRSVKEGKLTDAGQVLFAYALQILNTRTEAQFALKELRNLGRGKLILGANEHTVTYLLPLLDEFMKRFPQIKIEVKRCQASLIPTEILRHNVEIGVLTFQPKQPELQTLAVATDSVALVVSPKHSLAKRTAVSIRDLGLESFVAHNVVSPYRQKVLETFQRFRTPLNITVELPSIEAIKRMVESGNCIGILPRLCVETEALRGQLVAIPIKEMRLERKLRLAYRRDASLSHAGQAFLKVAKAAHISG